MKGAFVNFGSLTQRELPLHRNCGMEIVYVSEGRLRWVVGDHSEDISPGSVFFTLPWQVHGSEYAHEPGNRIHFLHFRLDKDYHKPIKSFGFHPDFDFPAKEAHRLSTVFAQATRHTWPASPELKWLLLTLVKRLEQGPAALFVQGLFRSMMAELADVVCGRTTQRRYLNPTERRVHDLLSRLEHECPERWNLARMTHVTHLGKTQLAEIFRKLTGDSPIVYLNRVRIARAETLLRKTDRTVTDIGFDCGFSTTQLFCRTFKKFANQTPTAFRRNPVRASAKTVIEWSEEEEQQRHEAMRRHEWL